MPKVSFLTSVFNGKDYIHNAIESVRTQSIYDWEYIIVDDGSTDGTIQELSLVSDKRVKVISLQRSGRGSALNEGLRHCCGEFIAILDADDQASKFRIEIQLGIFKKHPKFDVLSSECVFARDDLLQFIPEQIKVTELAPRSLLYDSKIVHSSVLIRTSSLIALGGYDEQRHCLFDFDLWIRVMSNNYKVGLIHLPLVFRMLHEEQFFESKKRARYLWAGLVGRYRVVYLFGNRFFDWLTPLGYFLYGFLPKSFRRKTASRFNRL